MRRQLFDWTSKDGLLFSTNAMGPYFRKRLFLMPASGGLHQTLPVEYGTDGSLNPDGQRLAFTLYDTPRSWKRYAGGGAPDIWVYDFKTHSAQQITDWSGTDSSPMWHRNLLFYVSDSGPEHRLNLWSIDVKSKERRQLTTYADYDVQDCAIGPGADGRGEIVFQRAGDLYLFDCATKRIQRLNVEIPGVWEQVAHKRVEIAKNIQEWDLSPQGDALILEARGDLWLVGPHDNEPRRLTTTPGVAERSPTWSPDGKWIAYWSDESGEYELHRIQVHGTSKSQQLTYLGPGLRRRAHWSPDSKRIAFSALDGSLFLLHLDDSNVQKLGRDLSGSETRIAWSPDSRWLAFTRAEENFFSAIWVHGLEKNTSHRLTSGRFNDNWPTFDRAGRWLYFVSDRDFSKLVYDRIDGSFVIPRADTIVRVPLRREFASDDPETGSQVEIDVVGFEERAISVGGGPAHIWNLSVSVDGRLWFTHVPLDGEPTIRVLDPNRPDATARTASDGRDFRMSLGGKLLIVRKGDTFSTIETQSEETVAKREALKDTAIDLDLRAEWVQVFRDAEHYFRELFYDPTFHSVDWKSVVEKYTPLGKRCASRDDVNYVIDQFIGEFNVSHAGVGNPGAVERPEEESVGLLGVDFEVVAGQVKIQKILRVGPWDTDVRRPLAHPGVNVEEGDVLIAVNGKDLRSDEDPYAAFCGLADKEVVLTVARGPDGNGNARTVSVRCLADEDELRYRAWVEATRKYVDERSKGQLGYLHLSSTGHFAVISLQRQFYGQRKKAGLVIDTRWNNGGMGPNRFIEFFNRPHYFYDYNKRTGGWSNFPEFAHFGPKCMLTNGASGSGGDNIAYLFRRLKLGKLVGTRSAGALLAGAGSPPFVDGGSLFLPVRAPYVLGAWVIEGHGVSPDIVVPPNPVDTSPEKDPQLNRAIDILQSELKAMPTTRQTDPPFPDGRHFRKDVVEQ
jgi:tricorn protease